MMRRSYIGLCMNNLLRLWVRIRAWLVIPAVYAMAAYCCAIELISDLFCDIPLQLRLEEWSQSAVLRQYPHLKRVAVVTGADGTIGTEICRLLLELDFDVAVFGLRRPRLNFLNDWDRVHLFKCDFLVENQVYNAVNDFKQRFKYVDLMIFGAGAMLHPPLDKKNAVDPHYRINLFSHALLFDELRSMLEKTPRSSPKVIVLSSSTSNLGDIRLVLNDPAHAFRTYYNGYKSYCDSKLLSTLYFRYLAAQLHDSKVKLASVHPGVVPGGLYRYLAVPIQIPINKLIVWFVRKPIRAAVEVLALAFNDKLLSGYYYEHYRAENFEDVYTEEQFRFLHDAVKRELSVK